MLAEALESVRRQTGLASVARVIVSENGDTGDSEEVCKRFADLPLLYVRQQPPVSSLLHLKAIWPHIESPIVAILHDDDWWIPEHLQNSLAVLNEHPECGATFSNFYDTLGPRIVHFGSDKAWRVWVATGCDFRPHLLMLDKVSVLLACLLNSAFHYSTMVGRKEVVWESYLKMVAADNAWDNERTFPVFLSSWGPLGYVTKHAAMIRAHPAQEGQDLKVAAAGFDRTRVRTTQWLAQLEPETTALAVKKFNETAPDVPHGLLGLVSSQIEKPQQLFLMKELGLNLIPTYPQRNARWFIKQLCPPAILALQRKSRQFLERRR